MSTSLYWSPLPEETKEKSIYNLKWIMAERLGQYDGSVGENLGVVDDDIIPFLEGVAAGANKECARDAKVLIDAIKKYGKVQLTIHS